MNKTTWLFWLIVSMVLLPAAAAASSAGHGTHGNKDVMHHGADDAAVFEHIETVEGVRTEFQVMSLASMNMTDPDGRTHHIMVKLIDDSNNRPIDSAIGKIKVIGPDGTEQEGLLKDYGGIMAANFSFPQKGKYGVICLFKVGEKKHVVRFWYPRG